MQNELQEIVKHVIYKLRETGQPYTEATIAFIAQTTISEKTKKFYFEEDIDVETLKKIKDEVVESIKNFDPVAMQTIQMQIMYDDAFFENELIKQEYVKNQSIESGRLIDDVEFIKNRWCLCKLKIQKISKGSRYYIKRYFNFSFSKIKICF
jgi:hypothetical protein